MINLVWQLTRLLLTHKVSLNKIILIHIQYIHTIICHITKEKEEQFGEDRLGRLRTCLWDLLEYPETSKVGLGNLTTFLTGFPWKDVFILWFPSSVEYLIDNNMDSCSIDCQTMPTFNRRDWLPRLSLCCRPPKSSLLSQSPLWCSPPVLSWWTH